MRYTSGGHGALLLHLSAPERLRRPVGLLATLTPTIVYAMTEPTLAAVLALIPFHLHLMRGTEAFSLPLGGRWGLRRLRSRVLCQHRLEPRQQPAFVTVAQGHEHIPTCDRHMDIGVAGAMGAKFTVRRK